MDLEQDIAAGKILPVYVLASEEPLLVTRVVHALREAVVPPAARGFNLDQFEAKTAGATGILNASRTLPMMGKARLVIVREAEALGGEGLGELIPYLDKPAPETVLVLLCGKVDGRWKFFQAAKKKGFLHVLEVPRQLSSWVMDEAKRRGAKIQPDAARRLFDVVGRDLSRISSALEQLALYAGDAPVTVEHVDELIADTSERTVFELTDAVGEGSRPRALMAIAKLFEQRESAVGVLIMLARHFRQLALAREVGRGPDAARALGVPPFVVDKLMQQSRRLPAEAVPRAFALLAKADVDLKSNVKAALGERIVVERLVTELMLLGEKRRA